MTKPAPAVKVDEPPSTDDWSTKMLVHYHQRLILFGGPKGRALSEFFSLGNIGAPTPGTMSQ